MNNEEMKRFEEGFKNYKIPEEAKAQETAKNEYVVTYMTDEDYARLSELENKSELEIITQEEEIEYSILQSRAEHEEWLDLLTMAHFGM